MWLRQQRPCEVPGKLFRTVVWLSYGEHPPSWPVGQLGEQAGPGAYDSDRRTGSLNERLQNRGSEGGSGRGVGEMDSDRWSMGLLGEEGPHLIDNITARPPQPWRHIPVRGGRV